MNCCIEFEYTYRWAQILDEPEIDAQLEMLDANMVALEQAFTDSGGCPFKFPYRWVEIWPGLLEGDQRAIILAEENDRALEGKFSSCNCGKPPAASQLLCIGNRIQEEMLSDVFVFPANATDFSWVQGTIQSQHTGTDAVGFIFEVSLAGVWVTKYSATTPVGTSLDFAGDTFPGTIAAGTVARFRMENSRGERSNVIGDIVLSYSDALPVDNNFVNWTYNGHTSFTTTTTNCPLTADSLSCPDPTGFENTHVTTTGILNGVMYGAIDIRALGGSPTTVYFQALLSGLWANIASISVSTGSSSVYAIDPLISDVPAGSLIRFVATNGQDLAMLSGYFMVVYDGLGERDELVTWGGPI